jgi:FkbM family methyltransferase
MSKKTYRQHINFILGSLIVYLKSLLIERHFSYKWFPYMKGNNMIYDLNYFSKGDIHVIFDVGANIGQSSIKFRNVWPKASIYAFEPVLSSFKQLKISTSGRNIILYNIALGEQSGESSISINDYHQINSLKNISATTKTESIHVQTLDYIVESQQIERIDFLKIDVEGYEIEVLKGAFKCLENGIIEYIYLEVGVHQADMGKTYFCNIHSFLELYGYSLSGIYETKRKGVRKEFICYTNFLYKKNSITH